ncbi:MAG: type II secretion system protein [Sulfuricaulis sp.]|nr:type II secretion system protein [Sulfuricaulis sp.]
MRKKVQHRFARGVTLVELIVAIVIIGVALSGVLVVFIRNTSASADPVIAHQAISIAEAYLEEALTKNFTVGPGVTRPTYDDVLDYNFTDTGARDQTGTPISGLAGYTVQVQATAEALTVITASNAVRVQVTVTPAALPSATVVISAYRTNY